MAHVGRDYPLAFRRDLSLQVVNNRSGWAKEYIISFFRLGGTIGSFIRDFQPQCTVTFNSATGRMTATTLPFVVHGHTVTTKLVFSISAVPQQYSGSMTITDSIMGDVYSETWSLLISQNYQFLGRSRIDNTTLETPMVCFRDFAADLLDSSAQFVGWPP